MLGLIAEKTGGEEGEIMEAVSGAHIRVPSSHIDLNYAVNNYNTNLRLTSSMSASEKTKWSIVDALEHTLEEKSFSKISVADITQYCHIARQTFYNHFLDKYNVIDWVYAQLIKQTTCRIGIDMTWEEATSAKLKVMKSKQKLFAALYNIDTNEGLQSNEPRKVFDYYVANIARITGKKLDLLESSLMKIYCYGATHLATEWILQGANEPIEVLIEANKQALPLFAQRIFLAAS